MTSIDPDAMTAYQRKVLELWPATEAFAGAVDPVGRAKAVSEGQVDDAMLIDLLDKLGTSCESVDDASRHVSDAADAIGRRFRDASTAEERISAGDEVTRIFSPLRTIAARLWDLESEGWRLNPMYQPQLARK
jgi:hypothetical protein